MPKTLQVRDLPDDVHRRLKLRAVAEDRSLSDLVRAELTAIAERPTMAEMLQRLKDRPVTDPGESSADAVRAERPDT